MRVLIAAAIFGISFGNYGCSNEAKFAGRPMAATEAPAAAEAPASTAASPGAAIQTTADANAAIEMPSGDVSDTVSLTSSAGAGGSVSLSSGSYKIGTSVNLMANSNSGYAFSSWGGDCAGQGSTCSLTMNANKAATAYFSCAGGYYSTGGTCQLIPTCGANSSWNGSSCVCNSGYSLINGTCQLPSNWVDVTTTNGTMPSTCNATPANCTMKDPISGLKWSNRRPDATWQGAIDHCRSLNYNGVSGWRLPTREELRAASTNGIYAAAKEGWMTASDMNAIFWSSSSSFTTPAANGDTNGAWYVFLWSGGSNHPNSGYSKSANLSVVCVQ